MMLKLSLSIAIYLSSWRHDDAMRCRAFTATLPTTPTKLQATSTSSSLLFAETIASSSVPSTTSAIISAEDEEDDDNTVVTVSNPKTGQTVTLIGTAHLSEKSNRQVQRLIETLQPNAVMIEIDPSRLERIGFDSVDEMNIARVTDSEDIELPTAPRKSKGGGLLGFAQEASIGVFSQVARALLTQMYKSLESNMDQKAGGEFLQAVRSAEACDACDTLIMGDRNSIATISRVAELAIDGGDFMGVLNRLQAVNQEEIEKFEPQVRKELLREKGQEGNDDYELDRTELTTAIIESLKEDEGYRTRLFGRLEEDVPEFFQAFIKERDYLMSESIIREFDRRPEEVRTVVGVVGLAHVPGMEEHFRSVFADRPAPLARDIASVSYD